MVNLFPPNSAALLLKDVYYQEFFDYLSKTKDKFSLRLSADSDMSKKDSKLTLGNKKQIFEKSWKWME